MSAPDPNRLPPVARPSHYDLELVPDLDAATFTGVEAVTVELLEDLDDLVLHALDLAVTEAWLERDGQRLDATVTYDAAAETATLHLARTAAAGTWTLHAAFTGELNDKLVGFYRSTFVDDAGATRTLACTQFESTHARRAFPCWDEPAFKASFTVTLDVPDDLMAVSNAAEVSATPLGDGHRRVAFAPTMVMSTYLVAIVVGPLEATDPVDVDGVPLRVICRPGCKANRCEVCRCPGSFSLNSSFHSINRPSLPIFGPCNRGKARSTSAIVGSFTPRTRAASR